MYLLLGGLAAALVPPASAQDCSYAGLAAVQHNLGAWTALCRTCGGRVIPGRPSPICDIDFAPPPPPVDPNRERSRQLLNEGNAAFDRGDFEAALRKYEEACAAYGTDACKANIDIARGRIRQRTIDVVFDRAHRAHRPGNYAEAIALWDEVLRLDPANQTARQNRELAVRGLASQREFEERKRVYEEEQAARRRAVPGFVVNILLGDAVLESRAVLGTIRVTGNARCPYDANRCAALGAMPTPPPTPAGKPVTSAFVPPERETGVMRRVRAEIEDLLRLEAELLERMTTTRELVKVMELRNAIEVRQAERRWKEREYEEERVNHGIR